MDMNTTKRTANSILASCDPNPRAGSYDSWILEAMELYATSQIEEATRHSSETFKDMTERCNQYHSQIEDLTKEVEKLREFKRYVHDRLDKMGIPSDPEPANNASHGCRIEGRLNVVDRYREALVQSHEVILGLYTLFNNKMNETQLRELRSAMANFQSALHPLVKEGE
jgi:hypothetical protein